MADFDFLHRPCCADKANAKREENKYLDRLLPLWTAENTLLYGRLQNMAAVQTAIAAGWYYLIAENRFWTAITTSLVGFLLIGALAKLVLCDLAWKKEIGDSIKKEAPGLLPEIKDHAPGWLIMKSLAYGLWICNLLLFLLAVFKMCGGQVSFK